MIPAFLQNLETVLDWVLTASWQASVLAALVLILQRGLHGRLNPRWRYALWLLVILRLVLPVEPESALSLFQFAPQPSPALVAPVTAPLFAQSLLTPAAATEAPAVIPPEHLLSLYSLLAIIWLTGVIVLFLLTWQVNRRFMQQVAASPETDDAWLLQLFAEAKAELGIRRHIRLIENTHLQSPAIMGLFYPTLLLPSDVREKFDATELRLIFLHELAHLKRGDILVQGLIALLQILHWFNPVLWFAFRRMRADREPATDALVLSRTGEAEKERYGLMLIKLLEHFNQRHSLPTLVGILEDKDQFKRRFSLIAKFTRGAYGWSLLGVFVIAILAVACLTKSKTAHPPKSKPVDEQFELIDAARKGDAVTLQKLFDQGIVYDAKARPNQPTLFFCAGSPEVAELLIRHGADINARNNLGESALTTICYSNLRGAETARVLLKHGADANAADPHGRTPLMAAWGGDSVDVLIEYGAKLDAKTDDGKSGWSAMNLRSDGSYYDALVKHGLAFDPAKDGPDLLTQAASWSQIRAVRWLLDHGVDPNMEGDSRGSNDPADKLLPLSASIMDWANPYDHPEEVWKLLLEHGAKASESDALAVIESNNPRLLQLLKQYKALPVSDLVYGVLEKKSPAELQEIMRKQPPVTKEDMSFSLYMATLDGNLPAVEFFVQKGVDLKPAPSSAPPKPGSPISPLSLAAMEGHDDVVGYLLQHGAKAEVMDIAYAMRPGQPSDSHPQQSFDNTVKLLIAAGALKNITEDQTAVLLSACLGSMNPEKDMAIVKMLLDAGLNPNARGSDPRFQGKTVIELLQEQVDQETKYHLPGNSKPLLKMMEKADKNGTSPSSTDSQDQVPSPSNPIPYPTHLSHAISTNQIDVLKSLLDQGTKVYFTDMVGALSTGTGRKEMVKLLWDHGYHFCSSLAYAVSQDEPTSELEKLLDQGSLADPVKDRWITPLDIAALKGNMEAAQLLVKRGANPTPTNDPMTNPLNWAAQGDSPEMVDYLLKSGAVPDDVAVFHAIERIRWPGEKTNAIKIANVLIQAGGLKGISEDTANWLLVSACEDTPNLDGLQILLAAGLSPRSKRTSGDDQGKTVLEIIRAFYASPDMPWKKTLKPHLDLLEAADKGAPPKPTGASDAGPKPDMVKISLKVAEIDDDVYTANKDKIDAEVEKGGPEVFKLFNNLKGVSLLSTPSVTIKVGQKATIKIVREFPYPIKFDPARRVSNSVGTAVTVPMTPTDFVTKDVGVSAEITPSIDDGNSSNHGKIILNGKFSVTDFEGFTKSNMVGVGMPSFSTRESLFIESLDDNQEVSIWIPGARYDEQTIIDQMASGKTLSSSKIGKKRLLLFVSAGMVK